MGLHNAQLGADASIHIYIKPCYFISCSDVYFPDLWFRTPRHLTQIDRCAITVMTSDWSCYFFRTLRRAVPPQLDARRLADCWHWLSWPMVSRRHPAMSGTTSFQTYHIAPTIFGALQRSLCENKSVSLLSEFKKNKLNVCIVGHFIDQFLKRFNISLTTKCFMRFFGVCCLESRVRYARIIVYIVPRSDLNLELRMQA